MSEKTQQPTQKKLRDAAKQGQFPRSRLFVSAAVTLGGLGGALLTIDESARGFQRYTRTLLVAHDTAPGAALHEGLLLLARGAMPALIGALLAALAASAITTGGIQFNAGAVAPKLEKLNPVEGFKKLFSTRQLVDLLKGLVVAVIIVQLFWSALKDNATNALASLHHDGGLAALLLLLQPVVIRAAVVLLVLGAGDLLLQKHRHLKDLMMSKEEVKQEHKSSEGDPQHKAKRKALHRQLSGGGTARGVSKATAVVVNPTHLAIALRYDEAECEAPYIVAKGRENDALALRKEAARLGIPVLRDIPLARSLIHYDVGEEVPEELYQAAAALLKVALETKDLT